MVVPDCGGWKSGARGGGIWEVDEDWPVDGKNVEKGGTGEFGVIGGKVVFGGTTSYVEVSVMVGVGKGVVGVVWPVVGFCRSIASLGVIGDVGEPSTLFSRTKILCCRSVLSISGSNASGDD